MEMELKFQDPAVRRRRLLIILGVVMAVLAGVIAFGVSRSGPTTQSAELPKRTVVVAVRDLPARTVLQTADVTVRQVPDDPSIAHALPEAAAAVGRVTTVGIMAGQVLYPSALVSNAEGANFNILAPGEVVEADSPYWRAVSVLVPSDRAVAGAILAGQRVDLFATVGIEIMIQDATGAYIPATTVEGYQSGKSTKITFQDLEVLSAQPDSGMYIVKVDLHQAEEISHIAAVAPNSFSLALRPAGDIRTIDTNQYGETNDRIIVQYLYPVPKVLDFGPLIALPTPAPAESPVPGESRVPAASPTAAPPASPVP